ncbi:hypothetical protein [Nodosilinea sp. E11]|uniref:hypothetical protein n=1 Tax=Nodosilinea sp. E11 TaxID=3037479 RepID=UPI002934C0B5|nr:hypothetical protein [Nodosilinea sp. E11]WOD39413.1 hypothetical protein RRF56_24720 [Nodosilinea sp. E11]
MHRSLITAALTLGLVGSLGLAAFSQTHQRPQRTEQTQGYRQGRGPSQALATAAAQLGVSEANLRAALGIPTEMPPRPDLAAAATQLGVSETDLREVLRNTMRQARQNRPATGERPDPRAALAAAAAQLGVSSAQLQSALGLPAELPPRPDLAVVATQLGVSEADLREALRSAMGARHRRANPEAQGQ